MSNTALLLFAYFAVFGLIKAEACIDGECIHINECSYIHKIFHRVNTTNKEQEYLKKRYCSKDQVFCCEHKHMENIPLPWMVQIETTYNNKRHYLFGGVLIKSKYVLITAHSVAICEMYNINITGVRLTKTYNHYMRYDVKSVVIHENYQQNLIPENDIALIFLTHAISTQKDIIHLPHHDTRGDVLTYMGVQFISWIQFPYSEMLRAKNYKFRIFNKTSCITNYSHLKPSIHLCGEPKIQFSKNYKFGGHLISSGNTLIGLLSFRDLYGKKPYVFTYVGNYVDWIENLIK